MIQYCKVYINNDVIVAVYTNNEEKKITKNPITLEGDIIVHDFSFDTENYVPPRILMEKLVFNGEVLSLT